MRVRKVVDQRVRRRGEGIDLAGDLKGVFAVNVGEQSATTRSESKSRNVVRQVSRSTARSGHKKEVDS